MFLNSLNQLGRNCDIYIYGSGETGKSLLKYIQKNRKDIRVLGFIDSFSSGVYEGIKIHKINDFLPAYKKESIIIASCFWSEIVDMLNSLNIRDYIILSNRLLYKFSSLNVYGDFYFSKNEISENLKNILSVVNLFSEPDDIILYLALYGLRLNKSLDNDLSLNFFKDFNPSKQSDFAFLNLPCIKCAVDAGVFDGKETLALLNKLGDDSIILGFEPFKDFLKDNDSFKELLKKDNAHIFPNALWDKTDILNFSYSQNNQSGSTISRNRKQLVNSFSCNAVSLDTFFKKGTFNKIDLIRLDIEGSELEALHGSEKTIVKDRPQIAVSIYHQKKHLFEIPLYLNSILVDYHYSIGHYTSTFIDTVFYAIPNELVGI